MKSYGHSAVTVRSLQTFKVHVAPFGVHPPQVGKTDCVPPQLVLLSKTMVVPAVNCPEVVQLVTVGLAKNEQPKLLVAGALTVRTHVPSPGGDSELTLIVTGVLEQLEPPSPSPSSPEQPARVANTRTIAHRVIAAPHTVMDLSAIID
jgi:hypothetical protein